jgi:hypothetical protein
MPKISLNVPHQLNQDEAKTRISRLITEGRAKAGEEISDVEESWNGYVDTIRFRARGLSFEGRLEVQAAQVLLDLNLPFAAFMMKSRIEQELLSHARQLLA